MKEIEIWVMVKLFYKYESLKELKTNVENLLEFIIESKNF